MKVNQFSPWVGKEEYEEMEGCFDRNWITEGPKTRDFAEQLLSLMEAPYGVFAPNGTLAIYLALRSIDIGPGDEVLVPDFTFIGSATAVQMTGATPVFVDVNRDNFQIDVQTANQVITEKTRAVMPVHIYGTAANMDAVINFSKENNLKVIEDAAQAIGVRYKNQHTGTFGDVGAFSFFADKTITTGEGGFIVTHNAETYDKLLHLRNQGRRNRGTFIHPELGYNFRITDLQAAIGLAQMRKLDQIIARKAQISQYYIEQLSSIREITFFLPEPDANFIPFRMGILVESAHDLMEHLKTKEIETRSFFYPLHKQPCFAYLADQNPDSLIDEKFPNANYGYEHGVCLPTFPTIRIVEMDYVCNAIKAYYGN
jgi:perosamine synthetase